MKTFYVDTFFSIMAKEKEWHLSNNKRENNESYYNGFLHGEFL